jgi:hypothetical protein
MPDRKVITIRDLNYYQCAKIVAKSVFGVSGGREAKGTHYAFVIGKGVKSCGG